MLSPVATQICSGFIHLQSQAPCDDPVILLLLSPVATQICSGFVHYKTKSYRDDHVILPPALPSGYTDLLRFCSLRAQVLS